MGNFSGVVRPIEKHWERCCGVLNRSRCRFGGRPLGPTNHAFYGGQVPMNPSVATMGDKTFVRLFVCSLRAGVQPTLDPIAETF